jgi:hypothetical protein
MKRTLAILAAVILVACVGLAPAPANAINTLTDLNSSITIDPQSQSGAYGWVVDGVSNLYQ